MKKFSDLREGQILYLANEEELWEHGKESNIPDGKLEKHTKIVVHYDDSPEVFF